MPFASPFPPSFPTLPHLALPADIICGGCKRKTAPSRYAIHLTKCIPTFDDDDDNLTSQAKLTQGDVTGRTPSPMPSASTAYGYPATSSRVSSLSRPTSAKALQMNDPMSGYSNVNDAYTDGNQYSMIEGDVSNSNDATDPTSFSVTSSTPDSMYAQAYSMDPTTTGVKPKRKYTKSGGSSTTTGTKKGSTKGGKQDKDKLQGPNGYGGRVEGWDGMTHDYDYMNTTHQQQYLDSQGMVHGGGSSGSGSGMYGTVGNGDMSSYYGYDSNSLMTSPAGLASDTSMSSSTTKTKSKTGTKKGIGKTKDIGGSTSTPTGKKGSTKAGKAASTTTAAAAGGGGMMGMAAGGGVGGDMSQYVLGKGASGTKQPKSKKLKMTMNGVSYSLNTGSGGIEGEGNDMNMSTHGPGGMSMNGQGEGMMMMMMNAYGAVGGGGGSGGVGGKGGSGSTKTGSKKGTQGKTDTKVKPITKAKTKTKIKGNTTMNGTHLGSNHHLMNTSNGYGASDHNHTYHHHSHQYSSMDHGSHANVYDKHGQYTGSGYGYSGAVSGGSAHSNDGYHGYPSETGYNTYSNTSGYSSSHYTQRQLQQQHQQQQHYPYQQQYQQSYPQPSSSASSSVPASSSSYPSSSASGYQGDYHPSYSSLSSSSSSSGARGYTTVDMPSSTTMDPNVGYRGGDVDRHDVSDLHNALGRDSLSPPRNLGPYNYYRSAGGVSAGSGDNSNNITTAYGDYSGI